MAQTDFGFLLRQARERRGYDLNTAARRLRIRPDVVKAIEDCDYEHMPPRGYARNMVNAYARLVGLNPTDITRMYLDGVHDYQRDKQVGVSDGRTSGFDMPSSARSARMRQDAQPGTSRGGRRMATSATLDDERAARRGASRRNETQALSRSGADYRSATRTRRSSRDERLDYGREQRTRDTQNVSGVPFGGLGALSALGNSGNGRNSRRGGYTSSSEAPLHPSMYAAPMRGNVLQGKIPIIIAAVIILILLVVVISLLTGGNNKQEEDIPSVPITGLTDTTETEGDAATAVQTPTPVAPTQVTLTYKVADGMQAYIEMYADGADTPTTATTLTGPTEESVEVTGTLRFVTAAPGAVTLLVDDEEVDLAEGTAGSGVYEYTVDFDQYLVSWYEEHPEASPGAQAQQEADSAETEGDAS